MKNLFSLLSLKQCKMGTQLIILTILSGLFQTLFIIGYDLEQHFRLRGGFSRYPHRYPFYMTILIISIIYFALQLFVFLRHRRNEGVRAYAILLTSQILGHGIFRLLALVISYIGPKILNLLLYH